MAEGSKSGNDKTTVLVAIDGSEHAENAFRWYAQYIWKASHDVVCVTALELPFAPVADKFDHKVKECKKHEETLSVKYAEIAKQNGMSVRFVADFAKPGEFICETAKNSSAKLIITGTRGLGTLRRTITGSVSDYVIHHAHCPVIVYKH